jgi:hypothetical protein
MNSKWFIVSNIFNMGIYLNLPNGIARWIPINYDDGTFRIIYRNMKLVQYSTTKVNNVARTEKIGNFTSKHKQPYVRNIKELMLNKRVVP